MRGHIVKRGKTYSVVVDIGKDRVTGKRHQRWIAAGRSSKGADKKLTEVLRSLDTGDYMDPGKTPLAELLDRFLVDYAKPNLSPRAFERYAGIVKVHLKPALGHVLLGDLRTADVQRLYAKKTAAGLAPRSVRYVHTVLHKSLNVALKWGVVSRNVADGVDVPRAERPDMQTWDEAEITRFLEAAKAKPAYYALYYLDLFTGMRRSELLALRWHDVDLIMGQVNVNRGLHQLEDRSYVYTQPKSAKSRRAIALSPSALLVLNEYHKRKQAEALVEGKPLTGDTLVFCNADGSPLRPNTVSRMWQTIALKAGVKRIRLHDARHSHASLMLKQGIHPKIVQERLGHSSIQVTLDTYSHVAPGLQQAAALRFDEAFTGKYNESVVLTR